MVVQFFTVTCLVLLICLIGVRQKDFTFDKLSKELVNACKKYMADNNIETSVSNSFVVYIDELIEKEYIKDSESLDLNYKLAIVVDRDDKTTEEIEQYFSDNLKPCIDQIVDGVWTSNSFTNGFEQEATIEKLCVIIPRENQGALETLLMDALSEDTYKKNLINKSQAFVDEIAPEAAEIISTERLKLKTKLGVSLAVLYPEKVFSLIDEQLKSVSWEKSEILSKTFKTLIEI